jgi:hypothetical protein
MEKMNFERWLSRLFVMEEINGDGLCPTYLYRWTILRAFGYALYLHKFVGDDWSLDSHDHPKRFVSLGLRGHYTEHYFNGYRIVAREWVSPWLRTFPATHIHRLTGPTPESPCWTLVLTLKTTRAWGFWHAGKLIPWRSYVKSDTAKAMKSCD